MRCVQISNRLDPRAMFPAFGMAEAEAVVWVPSEPADAVVVEGQAPLKHEELRRLALALDFLPDLRLDEPLVLNDVSAAIDSPMTIPRPIRPRVKERPADGGAVAGGGGASPSPQAAKS